MGCSAEGCFVPHFLTEQPNTSSNFISMNNNVLFKNDYIIGKGRLHLVCLPTNYSNEMSTLHEIDNIYSNRKIARQKVLWTEMHDPLGKNYSSIKIDIATFFILGVNKNFEMI